MNYSPDQKAHAANQVLYRLLWLLMNKGIVSLDELASLTNAAASDLEKEGHIVDRKEAAELIRTIYPGGPQGKK